MAELLISAVGGGNQGAFGTASVANTAQGAVSVSIGGTFGSGTPVVTPDLPAHSLALEFTQTVDPLSGAAVRFTFGGALLQSAVTAGTQTSFGTAGVTNVAQGASVEGVEPPNLRLPFIYSATSQTPANLDLGSALPGYSAQNVPFAFGGALLVSSVTVGDSTAFGDIEDIEKVLGAAPPGISAGSVGLPIVTDAARNGSYIPLDASKPSGGTDALALRFDFDQKRPVTQATVGLSAEFGRADVANVAQGVFAEGVTPGRSGVPIAYTKVIRGGFVELVFAQAVTTWPAENVPFYFNETFALGPVGSEDSVFGAPTVSNAIEYLVPEGLPPTGVGTPVIGNLLSLVTPVWTEQAFFGTPSLANTAVAILVGGIAPPPQTGPNGERQIPSPFIDFRIRYLTPGGIAVPANQIATTHVIAFDVQFIDLAGRGPNPWVTGNARVEYTVRYIEPPFIASNIFGSHNVARIQVVAPSGWESSFISENHEFDINLQRIIVPTGEADPAGYGVTHVRNQFEVLRPTGWLSQNINFPIVYNLDQYVFVQPYMGTNSDPTQWPPYSPFVENKTRVLGPGGWRSSRFSVIGNIVENTADPLLPPGLDATLWGPETFIAHRIRYVGPEGWDSFYNTQYTVVYNNAAVLAPQGWDSAQVGAPEQVLNLNRTVKHVFPYGGETVGTAFIAYRVRTVYPSLFYDVPSGFPEVRFNPHPIAPAGIAPPQFGGHTVYEHFTIAYPKSVNVHAVPWVGEPIVENRNKTLRVFPSDQSLYGLAKVFNYNTNLTITAGDLTVWGSHLISYRTRTITVAPISVPVFSVTHRIRNVLPDPPSRRLIEPNGFYIGIVPSPGIRLATIYPEGINEEGYGKPILTRNTIEVPPGPFNLDQVGIPTLIFTQYLFPRIIPWPNQTPPVSSSDQNWVWAQRPRVTPHTIYAPSADRATQQAKDNHPQNLPHRIDQYLTSRGDGSWSLDRGWPWFGRPDVSNQHRVVGPVPNHYGWSPTSRFGNQTFTLSRQYVYPTPIRSLRFGLIMFLDVPQYVNLDSSHNGIAPLNDFGQHTVAPPPAVVTPEAKPSGFVATLWGTHRVELFIRTVSPQGIPHRGNPQQGLTNPWGLPLVGFPRVYQWGGYVFTLWGSTWVSHKNRELPVEGWNSLTLEDDDLGSFADRMRVRRRNPKGGLAGIGPDSAVGNHLISHSIRTILGRGISSYNSGDHIVKTVATILPAGWDSLEVGDIDRWEAGKVKPHGDDLSIMGTPRMLHPLRPSGPFDSAVGTPRVGVPIRPMGIPEIGFAGPSVSNPFGCTNRVVTPLPILSQQNVPQPVVTL